MHSSNLSSAFFSSSRLFSSFRAFSNFPASKLSSTFCGGTFALEFPSSRFPKGGGGFTLRFGGGGGGGFPPAMSCFFSSTTGSAALFFSVFLTELLSLKHGARLACFAENFTIFAKVMGKVRVLFIYGKGFFTSSCVWDLPLSCVTQTMSFFLFFFGAAMRLKLGKPSFLTTSLNSEGFSSSGFLSASLGSPVGLLTEICGRGSCFCSGKGFVSGFVSGFVCGNGSKIFGGGWFSPFGCSFMGEEASGFASTFAGLSVGGFGSGFFWGGGVGSPMGSPIAGKEDD